MVDDPQNLTADESIADGDAASGHVPGEATANADAVEVEAPKPQKQLESEQPEGFVTDEPPAEAASLGDTSVAEAADESEEQVEAAELPPAPKPAPLPPSGPIEITEEEEESIVMDWYILKVQSNRERSIAAALKRKVAIEGIEDLFGEIMVPVERVTEFKNGKKKVVERKLWPGYIAVQMHVNDDTWFAIRETSGIGDFTGASGKPTPMQPHEIAKILHVEEEETEEAPRLNIKFNEGDKVKVKDGNFESFEGEVNAIDEASGKVTIMISIFGRSTPVELEYWQVETL